MTRHERIDPGGTMPPEAPLAMVPQDLSRSFRDPAAPGAKGSRRVEASRALLAAAVIALTGFAATEIVATMEPEGLTILEIVMAALFTLTFFGIALGCVTSVFGLASLVLRTSRPPAGDAAGGPLDVALLVLTYNEAAGPVLANVAAMTRGLARRDAAHRFAVYVLSDTTCRQIVRQEREAVELARGEGGAIPIHYRHREHNIDRKVGNLRDWVTRWGGRHDAMMVLDADSLMDATAIEALADALARDPAAGLIQTVPRIANDETVFARLQAFANALMGPVFAYGLAAWSGGEANYWGHNAIIRTRAFVAAAGLPHLSGKPPFGGLVMSHDFVEAALIRRAGWRVLIRPEIVGSYEEAPPGLVDFILRDRRWCQGNIQHLRLLPANGFHIVSRFHLVNGIMAYLSAPLWAAFLVIGAIVALQSQSMPIDYFPQEYALFPTWPAIDSERAMTVLLLTVGVLLTPKLTALVALALADPLAARWGGWQRVLPAVVAETLLTALMAPILMLHQCATVARTVVGRDGGWAAQRRSGSDALSWPLVRFHLPETVIGLAMLAAVLLGVLTPLMLPIAVSLAVSIPLSGWLSRPTAGPIARFAASPERRRPPVILRTQKRMRAAFASAAARKEAGPARLSERAPTV